MTAEESYKRPVFVGPVADQLTAEQTFRAFAIGRGVAHKVDRGGGKGRDTRFHVGRAAPVHPVALDLGAEGVARPGRQVAHGHHIGMSRKHQGPCVGATALAQGP